jgi:hypothetical protein
MCDCRPCEAGLPCARVLLLSPKDDSDATRLWHRFKDNPPGYVNLRVSPTEHRAAQEAREPSEQIRCKCGALHAVAVYLLKFLRDYSAPFPSCAGCMTAQVARRFA